MVRKVKIEQIFEIKFNAYVVEDLIIEPPSHMEIVNLLRKIANQFSIDINKRKFERTLQFMARENSSMGNCATVYSITHGKLTTNTIEKKNIGFRLIVLPMADDGKSISNLTIEKSQIELH